ncbi:MAG: YkoP family protein [Bacillota bacterium]|nr:MULTISPECIES: hypothetical protein [Bacillaceae]WBX78666.1 hypothetical protein PD280_12320 [Virgibacillus salarius]
MTMRSYLLGVWDSIDPIYFACSRLSYISDNHQRRTMLRVRLTRYKGGKVVLEDGTVLRKNDLLLKIHLHNVKLIKELNAFPNDIKRAVFIYHSIKQAMPNLAMYVHAHPKAADIKAVIGITSLYRGAERLGFEKSALKNRFYRYFKRITLMPINMLTTKKDAEPVYLFMSKNKIMDKYYLEG